MLEEDEDINTMQPLDHNNISIHPLYFLMPQIIYHSSISDILGGIHNLAEEDSDDLEEQTKAMFAKLDHLDLGNHANTSSLNHHRGNAAKDGHGRGGRGRGRKRTRSRNKPLRKIRSASAVSTMHNLLDQKGSTSEIGITRRKI